MGVAGPFEDIPSLIIVTVGLGVFLLSLVQVYTIYGESVALSQMNEEANDISRAVRSYDKLLVNGSYTAQPTEGRFDSEKLNMMTSEQLTKDIVIEYKFNVTVIQFSHLDENGDKIMDGKWGYGSDIPDDKPLSKVSTPVVIKVNEGLYMLGQLNVTVWRGT